MYDPKGVILNIKSALKNKVETKLDARDELPEASVPSEMIKLRRRRTHDRITPACTQRWARATRKRKAAVTGAY